MAIEMVGAMFLIILATAGTLAVVIATMSSHRENTIQDAVAQIARGLDEKAEAMTWVDLGTKTSDTAATQCGVASPPQAGIAWLPSTAPRSMPVQVVHTLPAGSAAAGTQITTLTCIEITGTNNSAAAYASKTVRTTATWTYDGRSHTRVYRSVIAPPIDQIAPTAVPTAMETP